MLNKNELTKDLFEDRLEIGIRKRYSRTESEDSPHDELNTTFTWYLSSGNPSNFIDDTTFATSSTTPSNSPNDNIEASIFASDLILHFRSLVVCVEEFNQRFTSLTGPRSIANKRWCDEDQALSFCMVDNADDSILAIGGFQLTPLPRVGTEIDLRGRTVFYGSEYKKKLTIVDASVMALILVIDPEELYIGRKVRATDKNRCIVDNIVPIRNVIASATENSLLHVALRSSIENPSTSTIVKDGKLTIDFKTSEKSTAVKDCLDRYCLANRTKKSFEIEDFLEKCRLMGAAGSESQAHEVETWSDFQHS
jgi:hypothetical protein